MVYRGELIMTFEQIMTIILVLAPSAAAIGGIITAVKNILNATEGVIGKFEEVRLEIFNTKEYRELKDQFVIIQKENAQLKKKLNELLLKIDKIQQPED